MNTIIAAFCDQAAANDAIAMLKDRGVTDIELLDGTKGSEIFQKLRDFNVPEDRAQLYAEVNRRGAPIVCAHTDRDATEIAEELDQRGSLDLEAAAERWRKEGWNGYDMNALPFDAAACATERAHLTRESGLATEGDLGEEQALAEQESRPAEMESHDFEVVEEHVVVGKREVPRESLRVRTFIAERPVRQQVQLTEEHIEVQREPANEPVSPSAVDSALSEDEFLVTAHGEEAVVGKEARVVERVHVGKTAETHTETIEETERRRDVEVESIKEEETTPPRR